MPSNPHCTSMPNKKFQAKYPFAYGLRYSLFYRLGESTVNLYENNNPVDFQS